MVRNFDLIALPAYYMPMPVNKDGNGPAEPDETVAVLHEVWDNMMQTVCTCPSEDMARRVATGLSAEASSAAAFVNAIRILYDLDLPGLPPLTADFLMRADDPTTDAIWAAIQKRQPARYRA